MVARLSEQRHQITTIPNADNKWQRYICKSLHY